MKKRITIEGSAPSKLVQMMRIYGENKDMSIDLGTVKSSPPNLKIQLDSDGLMLEKGDMILTQRVVDESLQANDKVIVVGDNDTQFYYVIDKAVIY